MDWVRVSQAVNMTSHTCIVISMLDLLEDFLALRSIAYSRLDGSTPRPRRTLDVKLVCRQHPFIGVLTHNHIGQFQQEVSRRFDLPASRA